MLTFSLKQARRFFFHPQPMIFSHNLLEFQTFLFEQFEMFIKTIIIIKIFKIFFRQVPAISV